jgi:hypothetical protein
LPTLRRFWITSPIALQQRAGKRLGRTCDCNPPFTVDKEAGYAFG